jgi:hypothetical protein
MTTEVCFILVDGEGESYQGTNVFVINLSHPGTVASFQKQVHKDLFPDQTSPLFHGKLQVYKDKTARKNNTPLKVKQELPGILGDDEDSVLVVVVPAEGGFLYAANLTNADLR